MKLSYNGGKFFVESAYAEKDVIKAAGFRWNPEKKCWWTDEERKAIKLSTSSTAVIECDSAALEMIRSADAAIRESLEQSRATEANSDDIPIPVPEGLEFMPYQLAGTNYALRRDACLIGDEMGLGKTVQAIGIINADPTIEKVLIICPLSVKLNWQSELEKWLVRPFTIGIATSKQFPTTNIVIIHPDVLSKRQADLLAQEWDLLVVDEAHLFKSPKANRSKVLYGDKTTKGIQAKRRIALTGTPIPNRPVEIYPLLKWLAPSDFGSWKKFVTRYCDGYMGRYGWDVKGASNLDELQENLRSRIMVRRLKSDVLTDLPAKTRQIIRLDPEDLPISVRSAVTAELNSTQEAERTILEAQTRVELAKAQASDHEYEEAVQELSKLRQIQFGQMSALRHDTALAKAPVVVDHAIEMLEGGIKKIAIWAHHRDVIEALTTGLKEFGVVSIVGGDSAENRQASVEAFQNDPKIRVFIGSIQAAGVGITLTATSHAVFAELDWVPGNVSQAEDRHHRIGQRNNVTIQHLVLDGSLDANLAQVLIKKQSIIDAALDKQTVTGKSIEMIEAGSIQQSSTEIVEIEKIQKPSTATVKRDRIIELASVITPEQIEIVHAAIRSIAFYDNDRASQLNGVGFSKYDSGIGHSLAEQNILTARQAALGAILARKYRKQLSTEIVTSIEEIISLSSNSNSTDQ